MVETIGEAFTLGWQLKARCAYGNREGLKSVRQCVWTYDLDMLTLVTTRRRDFPLAGVKGHWFKSSRSDHFPVEYTCESNALGIARLPIKRN